MDKIRKIWRFGAGCGEYFFEGVGFVDILRIFVRMINVIRIIHFDRYKALDGCGLYMAIEFQTAIEFS